MIAEWHTTDLSSPCMQRVKLRHEGKIMPDVASAMYRGLLFHEAAKAAHVEGFDWYWDADRFVQNVQSSLDRERRVLTKVAMGGTKEMIDEAESLMELYEKRFRAYFAGSKLIGCETPIRAEFDGVPFASHLDLLFRDPDGVLTVWDWKTGDEPSFEYLIRNRQLACYAAAVEIGECMVGEDWIPFAEQPRVAWVHIDALKPYARATKAVDYDTGEESQYVKGDLRPLDKIVRYIPPVDIDKVTAFVVERNAMAEADFWPASPIADGCRVCESRKWCPTLIQEQNHE